MFQGMFRNRGRPPDPLPIGGYEQPTVEESNQIPVHQLVETPRQLPLPSVRELEQDAIMQQEPSETNHALAESRVSQSLQQDDNMLNSQEGRLTLQSRQVMSPNQAIPIMNQEVDTFSVPNLPFSQAQRNQIFSETSSRIYRELCGPEGVVLQQNNILQQVIQEVRHDPTIHGTISEQQENIGQIVTEIHRLRDELAKMKLTLKQGFVLIDDTCAKHASVLEGLQSFAGAEIGANQRTHETLQRYRVKWEIFSRKRWNWRRTPL